jgi:hypothetical protein
LLLGALASASPLSAVEPGPTANWQRASSPDGRVSILTPCNQRELQTKARSGGFEIVCEKDGLKFWIRSGLYPTESGKVMSYNQWQARVTQVVGGASVTSHLRVDRHRAIRAFSNVVIPMIEVIDYRPEKPLVIELRESKLGASKLPGNMQDRFYLVEAFLDSLEIRAA